MKTKEPKKLFLTKEEAKNIASRQALYSEHQFYMHMINNSIVEYLKGVVYPRLKLDINKDYPLSNTGEYLIIEEDNGKSDPNEVRSPEKRAVVK